MGSINILCCGGIPFKSSDDGRCSGFLDDRAEEASLGAGGAWTTVMPKDLLLVVLVVGVSSSRRRVHSYLLVECEARSVQKDRLAAWDDTSDTTTMVDGSMSKLLLYSARENETKNWRQSLNGEENRKSELEKRRANIYLIIRHPMRHEPNDTELID